jgi:hypothetical protein
VKGQNVTPMLNDGNDVVVVVNCKGLKGKGGKKEKKKILY